MAITAITPSVSTAIVPGESVSFTINDTYTSLVIKVQTSTALINAYSTALGGGQPGYSVLVADNGDGTHTVTTSSNAGWDVSPQLFYITEDETGASATTNLSYVVTGEAAFPHGSYPYNPINSSFVSSFNGRTGSVVPAAGDYDVFYYTEAEADALYALALPLAGGTMVGNIIMSSTETVDGRDLSVDGTKLDLLTVTGAVDLDQMDVDVAANTDRAPLSGAGAPGVSTGDGKALGQVYVDTTADKHYSLVDATVGANVWDGGSGGVTDHGALTGLSDDDHPQYANTGLSGAGAPGVSTGDGNRVGTIYVDTTADESYTLTDNTSGSNVWSSVTGGAGVSDHGALTGLADDDHPQYANTGLTGAGAPGVSTGDGNRVGTVYVDTTADEGYILTDNTGGANVWSTVTGAGGVTDHGALTGLSDDDHTIYANTGLSGAGAPGVSTGDGNRLGTVYVDTTADEGYFLTDNSAGANVWSTASGAGGGTGDVTAAADLGDNLLIRGDGAGKGVQNSGILVSDGDKLEDFTQLQRVLNDVGVAAGGSASLVNVSDATGTATGKATGPGAFAAGEVGALNATSTAKIEATSNGSVALGYVTAINAGSDYQLLASGGGDFVAGRCSGQNGTGLMQCTSRGGFVGGYVSEDGTIEAVSLSHGSFSHGYVAGGGIIRTTGALGAIASGSVPASGCSIIASDDGAVALGRANQAAAGSATIAASGIGSLAGGAALGVASAGAITASGDGSIAWGNAVNTTIAATAANSFQFGPGTNAVAESLQVGDTTDGLRLLAGGTTSTVVGSFWTDGTDVFCRTGGVDKNLTNI